MSVIELKIGDIRNVENPSEAYALLLKEKDGEKVIPVMIGWSEARSLVLAMNKTYARRPTPHDLFIKLADYSGCYLENVFIYKFEEGVYYTYLRMKDSENKSFEIDSRTSDAVTLALSYRVPIFIDGELFEKVSLSASYNQEKSMNEIWQDAEDPGNVEKYIDQQLSEMSLPELETLLEGAVESEDFELASKIHEEIERRKV